MSADDQTVGPHFVERGLVERHRVAVAADVEVVPVLSVLVHEACPAAVLDGTLCARLHVGYLHRQPAPDGSTGQDVLRRLCGELYVAAPVARHDLVGTAVENDGHDRGVGIGGGHVPVPAYRDDAAGVVPRPDGGDVGIVDPSARPGVLQVDVVVAVDGGVLAREAVYPLGVFVVPCHVSHRGRKGLLAVVVGQLPVECFRLGGRFGVDRPAGDVLGLGRQGGLHHGCRHAVRPGDDALWDDQLVALAAADFGHDEQAVGRSDDVGADGRRTVEGDFPVVGGREKDVLVVGDDNRVEAGPDVRLRTHADERRCVHVGDGVSCGVAAGCGRQREQRKGCGMKSMGVHCFFCFYGKGSGARCILIREQTLPCPPSGHGVSTC